MKVIFDTLCNLQYVQEQLLLYSTPVLVPSFEFKYAIIFKYGAILDIGLNLIIMAYNAHVSLITNVQHIKAAGCSLSA